MTARLPPDAALSRRQLLREMGISPLWQLRRAVAENLRPSADDTAPAVPASLAVPPSPVARVVSHAPATPASGEPCERAAAIAQMNWQELAADVAGCRACGLCQGRKQAVLGVGDRQADWLFIGEGPGAEEDARGEPFVGPAGRLLDAMLAAIHLRRGEDVYIANAVKCRPPNNRTPLPEEIAACAPYLQRQMALLQPRLLVLLGRAAAHAVLGDVGPLGGLRGKTFPIPLPQRNGETVPVVVTYHPAYLLRNPLDKARAWDDLCLAREVRAGAG